MSFAELWPQLLGNLGALALSVLALTVLWRRLQAREAECEKCRREMTERLETEHRAHLAGIQAMAEQTRLAALEMAKAIDRLTFLQTSGRSPRGS